MMSYDKEKLEQDAIREIRLHKVVCISHLVTYLPCSRATFYALELDKLDTIKEEIERVRVSKKVKMQLKWEKSRNPLLQLSLYKLLADDDELARLSKQSVDHTTQGQPLPAAPPPSPVIVFYKPEADGTGAEPAGPGGDPAEL